MSRMQALASYNGPMVHVNHSHRLVQPRREMSTGTGKFALETYVTGNNFGANELDPYSRAAMDAEALKHAASPGELFGSGGPFKQFPNVEAVMKRILTHAVDPQYLGHLRSTTEYLIALSYLSNFILGQSSELSWYEMQKKVAQFMFYTADPKALSHLRARMPLWTAMLERFKDFALAQNDAQTANQVAQLQRRT